MIFVLPETKGISLERMDKIFGEVDAVVAGEATTELKMGDVHHQENKEEQVQTHTSLPANDQLKA